MEHCKAPQVFHAGQWWRFCQQVRFGGNCALRLVPQSECEAPPFALHSISEPRLLAADCRRCYVLLPVCHTQCGKLEPLMAFDDSKRSCRAQLARRRKAQCGKRGSSTANRRLTIAAATECAAAALEAAPSTDSLSLTLSSHTHTELQPAATAMAAAVDDGAGLPPSSSSAGSADMARLLQLHQERCTLLERQIHLLQQQQTVSTQLAVLRSGSQTVSAGASDDSGVLSAGDLARAAAASMQGQASAVAPAHSEPIITYVPYVQPSSFTSGNSSGAGGAAAQADAYFAAGSAFFCAGTNAMLPASSAAFLAAPGGAAGVQQDMHGGVCHSMPLPQALMMPAASPACEPVSSYSNVMLQPVMYPRTNSAAGWASPFPAAGGAGAGGADAAAAVYAERTGSCTATNSYANMTMTPCFDSVNNSWQMMKQEQHVLSAQDMAACAAECDTSSGRLAYSMPNLAAAAAATAAAAAAAGSARLPAMSHAMTSDGSGYARPTAAAAVSAHPFMVLGESGMDAGDVIMEDDNEETIAGEEASGLESSFAAGDAWNPAASLSQLIYCFATVQQGLGSPASSSAALPPNFTPIHPT